MVEFMNSYRPPMDRGMEEQPLLPLAGDPKIEDPIIPISQIGTTVIDGGGGNLLTNLDKMIRLGTKKVQLVLFGGQNGSPSALVSSYGTNVRREIKEKARATGVEITGIELAPQRIQGMSGFNAQAGSVSEEKRQDDIRQAKDALKFAMDVGGRGVDILSNEFSRNIIDASWNKDGKYKFFDNNQNELTKEGLEKAQITKYLIDKRTGNIVRESVVRTNDRVHRVRYQQVDPSKVGKKDQSGRVLKEGDYIDIEGNFVDFYGDDDAYKKLVPVFDNKLKQFAMDQLSWHDLEKERQEYNKRRGLSGENAKTTEEYAFEQKMATQQALARGQSLSHGRNLDYQIEGVRQLTELKKFAETVEKDMNEDQKRQWITDNVLPLLGGRRGEGIPPKVREELLAGSPSKAMQEAIEREYSQIQGNQEMVRSYRSQEEEIKFIRENVVTPDKYAKEKTFDSYAEAGLQAWKLTKQNKLGDKPLYIGPEIGWAGQSYGGHPQEFKEIVQKSRVELAKKLAKEGGLSESEAKDQAKKHIKGMLDTSHMSMWYKHFARNDGESDDAHLKRFNGWMKDQVQDLVKAGVVGGVQVVDSVTADHAHLPVGQGVFDMVGLVKAMKASGFDGAIISEGHEEEQFTGGRILTATWEAFGSPVANVAPGQRGGTRAWGGMNHSYFGYQMPHAHIIGAYSPSNEWSLWSDTPFE